MSSLDAFKKSGARPPGPSPRTGYKLSNISADEDDSAHYILRPDIEFYRPWIASAGVGATGLAFVWPMPIQGFTLASTPELGIHKYIGVDGADIDVIYPDEYHITLTGFFPGRTAIENVQSLRAIILHKSVDGSKSLALPLVAERVLNVVVANYSFTHDETDLTEGISYTIECIQEAVGSKQKLKRLRPPKRNPTNKVASRGGSTTRIQTMHSPTARGVAAKVYRDPSEQGKVLTKNLSQIHIKTGIPAHQIAYRRMPPGTILDS